MQIEKEMAAIIFGATKFHEYIYAKDPIHMESDYRTLGRLFKKALSQTPQRIQRMMLKVQKYDLHVKYKKGTELHHWLGAKVYLTRMSDLYSGVILVSFCDLENVYACSIYLFIYFFGHKQLGKWVIYFCFFILTIFGHGKVSLSMHFINVFIRKSLVFVRITPHL